MKHEIIKTDNYLLIVDESEIKAGEFYLLIPELVVKMSRSGLPSMAREWKKIIAHLPLNGSPILEGVDLLPPLEDKIDVEKMAHAAAGYPKHEGDREKFYIKGYTQALEDNKDKKYTEEDLLRLLCWADSDERNVQGQKFEDFIQSLSQPKMPIGFEFEASKSRPVFIGEPKTRWNVAGFTRWTWEGKYIY